MMQPRGSGDEGNSIGGGARYQLLQHWFSIADNFWIEDDRGRQVARVVGKVLSIPQTFTFEDAQGNEVCTIRQRMLSLHDTMQVEGPNGQQLATIQKALFAPFHDHWQIKLADGQELSADGDIFDHEYRLTQNGQLVADISTKWFTLRDSYGVNIAPGQNDMLILAIAVAIDAMSHKRR